MLQFQLLDNVRRWLPSIGFVVTVLVADADGASAIVIDLDPDPVRAHHEARSPHIDQTMLTALVAADPQAAFQAAFGVGDEMFETAFNSLDGVGANVGGGQRFTHVPRADLRGGTEWFDHRPARETGPNAENCTACHNLPTDDAAGNAAANVHRDPLRGGVLAQFIERNTPHLFAPGAVQRVAEEMFADLQRIRAETIAGVCATGISRTARLESKGVSFGSIAVLRVPREAAAPT